MSTLPPPPPPPLTAPVSPQFDFGKPFRFVFEDKEWLQKILIGGLFYLASFLIIGAFFTFGYLAQLVRNVIAGKERPLPEWTNLGDMFGDGVKVFVAMLLYLLPVIFMILFFVFGGIAAGAIDSEGALAGLIMTCGMMLFFPLVLIIYLVLPAALLRVIVSGQISAAFELKEIIAFIRRNFLNYFLSIAVYIIANTVAQFGVILLCIGVIFTAFWSMVVTAYSFAETYRLDRGRTL